MLVDPASLSILAFPPLSLGRMPRRVQLRRMSLQSDQCPNKSILPDHLLCWSRIDTSVDGWFRVASPYHSRALRPWLSQDVLFE
jgi:hypothetical protein